ncbi:rhamnogalacturonan lyase [Sphingobacterium shayense]|uniref:rhamnogalacturonan lyase n=1 Tax=Sphingobacterium shayense TaxID=626343 RepID=UPI001553B27B|nr:rhamnogalacturonan lyase [Sphingobacterium shayense]NQD70436.1 rhamnogalacturonan lyase [Sphingobacterium shayense]
MDNYSTPRSIGRLAGLCLLTVTLLLLAGPVHCQRYMEYLDRSMIAVKTGESSVFFSWRLLANDDFDTPFHIYRQYAGEQKVRLTKTPIVASTCFQDNELDPSKEVTYTLTRIIGKRETTESTLELTQTTPVKSYLEVRMNTPEGYTPSDMSVGDLDGDGSYELIVHQTGKAHDNSHLGITDRPIFQAYRFDGTMLWEIDLGVNIREGAHYTQFMVYDLDNDGRAEFVCKTADGTRDGLGWVMGDSTADYRVLDSASRNFGRILEGPEYLTVFDGLTGAAISTTDYLPERGELKTWGDDQANRSERYLGGIAYLDGVHPSLVMTRGYYERTALVAWDFKDKKLVPRWVFDTKTGTHPYAGQGYHSLSVADVDQDGKDEIIFGAMCIDDDGTGLYTTKLGHGDALHVSDLDPDRPGFEIFGIHELKGGKRGIGASLLDAKTGKILFKGAIDQDVPRGLAANIDPDHRGAYMWWLGSDLYDMKGKVMGRAPEQANFLIWWDDDFSREMLDHNTIEKYKHGVIFHAEGATSNNGTKRTPSLSADILGDWREELILRADDNKSIRIYTTTIPTRNRLYTLMQDPVYRLGVAWQNVAYNQPPHAGYYIGAGMDLPKRNENIRVVDVQRTVSDLRAEKRVHGITIGVATADDGVIGGDLDKTKLSKSTN